MRRPPPSTAAALAGLAVMATAAAALFLPFLVRQREVLAATPGPPALFALSTVILAPQHRLCLSHFVLDRSTQVLRLVPGTYRRPGPRLAVEVRPDGFPVQRLTVAGYADNAPLDLRLRAPTRPVSGRVCLRNVGAHSILLPATGERRSMSPSQSHLDGHLQNVDVSFTLLERRRASIAGRLAAVVDHATFWWPVGAWAGWCLALLACILLPVLAMWAVREAASRPPES